VCRAHIHDQQTDRPCYSVCSNRPHLASANMQPNNSNKLLLTRMSANAQRDGHPAEQCHKLSLTPTTGVPCSNDAKTRNPLKFGVVPQTTGPISAASGPKFTILWGHLEDILLRNNFFPIVDTCLSCKDIARQSYAMVSRWRFMATFLRPVFSASRVQHVSDLHLKFALRPHQLWKYGRHPICDG